MTKVFVYRNLHFRNQVMWSLREVKSRKVIAREPVVVLEDCSFKVSEKGRQRVLREKRKNVHAGVQGTLIERTRVGGKLVQITYDPYKYSSFVRVDTLEPVIEAKKVILRSDGVWAVL